MIRRAHVLALLAIASGVAGSPAGHASELTYTYVDFQAVATSGGQTGQKVPVPGQTVAAETEDGDGISIGGSVAIGQRFFAGGRFQTSVIDVNAVVTNPFGVTTAQDNFDLIQSRLAFGYYREMKENFDLTAELSLDSVEYDFGSFAGESFDMRDEGVGIRLGFRWNPRVPLEVSGYAHYSPVGKADLTTGAVRLRHQRGRRRHVVLFPGSRYRRRLRDRGDGLRRVLDALQLRRPYPAALGARHD